MDRPGVIALLTDFGTADYFVGAVKGVILAINPGARIIDITHDIPPQDIEAGAFTLLAARDAFAAGTVFLAVVDPGVGSKRRPIIVETGDQVFVGPDNGLFSYLYESGPAKTFHVTNESFNRRPVSPTFHGRDIFGPIAAHLSLGTETSIFGDEVADEVRLPPLTPTKFKEHVWKGRIIHVDRFGNCITNISRSTLSARMEKRAKLTIKGRSITAFRKYFADGDAREKLFAVWGSAGFLEIASRNRSAAQKLKVKRGDSVRLEINN